LGFAKNVQANLDNKNKRLLTILSGTFFRSLQEDMKKNIKRGELIPITGGTS